MIKTFVAVMFCFFVTTLASNAAVDCEKTSIKRISYDEEVNNLFFIKDYFLADAKSEFIFGKSSVILQKISKESREKILLILKKTDSQYLAINAWERGFLIREFNWDGSQWQTMIRDKYSKPILSPYIGTVYAPAVAAVARKNDIYVLTSFHLAKISKGSILDLNASVSWIDLKDTSPSDTSYRGVGLYFIKDYSRAEVAIILGKKETNHKPKKIVYFKDGSQEKSDDLYNSLGGSSYTNLFYSSDIIEGEDQTKFSFVFSGLLWNGLGIYYLPNPYPLVMTPLEWSTNNSKPIGGAVSWNKIGLWFYKKSNETCILLRDRITVIAQKKDGALTRYLAWAPGSIFDISVSNGP